MSKLAYYAHSHGSGHCRYADFISSLIPGGIDIYTSRCDSFKHAANVVRLDVEDVADTIRKRHLISIPPYLHYSPVDHAGIKRRSLQLLQSIADSGVDLVVVDVSVEVAALLRASAIPYLYVKMLGHRNDLPHVAAYRGAMGLVAYYPEALESEETPLWAREKTTYLGFKPRVGNSAKDEKTALHVRALSGGRRIICLVKGFGGAAEVDRISTQIRQAYQDAFLVGLGDFGEFESTPLDFAPGIVDCVLPYLKQADVVVGACGSNLTAEVIGAGVPFVPLACKRPYDEQEVIAQALFRNDLGIPLAEFLSGTFSLRKRPIAMVRPTNVAYKSFFQRLTFADDWREVLHPNLMSTITTDI